MTSQCLAGLVIRFDSEFYKNSIIYCRFSKEITERYKHFVEAHNEACEKLIPNKKKKEKKKSLSKDTRVLEARQEVQKAFDCYQIESTKENQAELQTKKRALQKTYDTIESEELKKEIKKLKKQMCTTDMLRVGNL